jgi:hypothetical protein
MKVFCGSVGITLNANASAKFFLIAPELTRLASGRERNGRRNSKR